MRSILLVALAGVVGCYYDFERFTPTVEDSALVEDSSSADSFVATDSAQPDTFVPPTDTSVPAPSCTDAEGQLHAGHCYFPLAADTGNAAKTACEAKGAHLVTITSADEEAFVETIRVGRDRWIGLRRPPGSSPIESSFAWVTGETVTFKKWAGGEPSGSGECVLLRASNSWADQDCTKSTRDVVCERE